jgi:hypothetical protein
MISSIKRRLLLSLTTSVCALIHAAPTPNGDFQLTPEVEIESLSQRELIDVNLGHSAEALTQAIWKQLTGETPDAEWTATTAARLGTAGTPRRIDLAVQLATEADVHAHWTYSDPWQVQIPLEATFEKTVERDVGAVLMYFFTSPDAPNGGSGWANNHAPGMLRPSPSLAFYEEKEAYYKPEAAGFWYREFKDAQYAGLDFFLLNTYGPDLDVPKMSALTRALERIEQEDGDHAIKLGLFDDTWTWGQPYFGPLWETLPDCENVESTAHLLYQAKWRPFFQTIPQQHWYTIDGKPMIYFYNNNTLQNRHKMAEVFTLMKALFKADFGIEPFIVADRAFQHAPGIDVATDSEYDWFTLDLPGKVSTETRNGTTLAHAMVRWDSTSRSNNHVECIAKPEEHLFKDDTILKQVLDRTQDNDILVIATWNDLGEGTGINRCYDYYWDGEWKKPSHFMDLIRRSQSGERLIPAPAPIILESTTPTEQT